MARDNGDRNNKKANINTMSCVAFESRKEDSQYSFSKNIDYERITDRQKRKHLGERQPRKTPI